MRTARSLLVLVWLCWSTLLAHAQDDAPSDVAEAPTAAQQQYRSTIAEALAEYEAGHFEEAQSLMLRAHAQFPNARTLRGLGMVSFELRQYADSVRRLEQALRSDVKPLEGELRAQAEALLERASRFVGKIMVRLEPADARLLVDGESVDRSQGEPLLLTVGEHIIEAHAPGTVSVRRKLRIVGGEHEALSITLAPLASEAEVEPARRRWYKNPWLWVSAGVVIAAGVATATTLTLTRDAPSAAPYEGLIGEAPLRGASAP